jgi:acyl-coenzyme A thioesterase PaaI-like protein
MTGRETGGQLELPWRVLTDYRCFGCSPNNDKGLRLRFQPVDDGITCVLRFDRDYESHPGVVHGGILSTVCDEIMGNLLVLRVGIPVFTTTLRVRFITSASVGVDYRCVATTTADSAVPGPYQARAEVFDEDGGLVVSAVGQYQPIAVEDNRARIDLTDEQAELIERELAKLRADQ